MAHYPFPAQDQYVQLAGGYPPNTVGWPSNTGGLPVNTGLPPIPGYGQYTAYPGYPPQNNYYTPGQNYAMPYPNVQVPQQHLPQALGVQQPPGVPQNQQPPTTDNRPPPSGSQPPRNSPNQQPTTDNKPSHSPGERPPPHVSPNQQPPPTDRLQPDTEPALPPPNDLVNVPGYDGLTFDNVAQVPPPPVEESEATPNTTAEVFQNTPSLTEEEAREALLEYVSENCCYGSKAAKQMTIRDINFNSAVHYKLETYGEKRETAWAFEPFKGQCGKVAPSAGPGYAPGVWDITVINNKANFVDSIKHVEVPNTSNLRPCHKCKAFGCVRCEKCKGFGGIKCTWCDGKGTRTRFEEKEDCHSCHGAGYDKCKHCNGTSNTTCDVCKGNCQLRYYVKLTVTWTNHVSDKIFEAAGFPKDLIRDASGETAFKDEQPRVRPITTFPDRKVNNASKNLVQTHGTAFPNERILGQRQEVRIVPVAEVDYTWKSSTGKFFVYGFEKKVHFPNYPQACICGCQII